MADVIEVREDNRREVVAGISKALASALETIGLVAEGAAKRLCPVDTGRLRNSITHQVVPEEKAAYIGTNVEYAVYVELRDDLHHESGQAHYLRDAAADNAGTYRRIVESALRNG